MTNGEKIQQLFPNAQVDIGKVFIYVWLDQKNEIATGFTDEWWNAEYKEPTTKNDLRVSSELEKTRKKLEKDFGESDCISRADVLKLMQDNWHTHNGDWAMQESMDDIRALPSVTPQEPTDKKFTKADIDAIVKAINKGWELRINEILDKIRAELIQSIQNGTIKIENGNEELFRIINKYKVEIEPQESEDKK